MSSIAVPHPGAHTGQATQIEQARAQAEVLAAMEAAKRWPRDEDQCEQKMRRACARPAVAEKAFWAFPRAGEQLTGSTIHLAKTLAGIWGNLQFGVVELERNSARRESQMLAVAWELETNTRATTTFLVPHLRDTRNGTKDLTDLRDVYENNANQGARRVREMIFKILPDWYTETAEDICRATLEKSDKPIAEQRAALAKAFESLGIRVEQLELKIGRAWDETTPGDLAILKIVGKSIRRGEATVAEQFPPLKPAGAVPVTVEEITGGPAVQPEPPPAASEVRAEADVARAALDQHAEELAEQRAGEPEVKKRERRMFALLNEAGVGGSKADERARRLRLLALILDRDITSSSDLSHDDRGLVVTELEVWKQQGRLVENAAAALDDGSEDGGSR
ncbi:hypothetical protein [Pseudonocardia asaccharolytica]|uniref:Uncharacterized protein n=1 Tax=Pseudonocardia asaccharolytica DSM 44247 = NBRC 16224 TaxID=1123024 RepID=A0A511D3D8_9PSEU|nr:hypothetical protein [Pseudonocardia asaccharolytica]GEL19299.1 hypothetical protein PA7_31360 [Pseudonocardia asaccharolytica DSM 44247 = NBRC 16224]